ncbi:hypothetical protein [Serratia sp. BIGb0163]|uniref:hypothetical protein n=2 Tax=Enterobacterales TaxID=91347 RepID=UPI00216A459D|nr:hypothetical protein [Serratia sp. BIGb0163]MCS4266458.1 hypothetical protein [Serratia sp. BIGb0163]
MRLFSSKIIFIFCSFLYSSSVLANSQHYLVEDIKNLNLYLWNGPEVKDRILIGYNFSGGMDFNATTGLICGGVGEASSYLWAANVKSGLKKSFFPSSDVYFRTAPINNVVISSNDGRCIFTDGENIYSYNMNSSVSKVIFSGGGDKTDKPHRLFFNDKNNIAVAIFDKHFSLLSKSRSENTLKEVHFSKDIKYSLKSLGDFAYLSDNGDVLYVNAYLEDSGMNEIENPALLSINTRTGVVNNIYLPRMDDAGYGVEQFYVFNDEHKIAMLLGGRSKPVWYVFTENGASKSNGSDYGLLFNKYNSGLKAVQLTSGHDYFYSVTTDKGDLIKINLSGGFNTISFDVKGELNRTVSVSHGEASYPFVEPKLSRPKKGSAVKVLGDYMVCKDLNNSPDEKNCGSARSGVDAVVQDIRTIESQEFVKISPEKDPDLVFWTVVENLQSVN